jgi:hypothetical protein
MPPPPPPPGAKGKGADTAAAAEDDSMSSVIKELQKRLRSHSMRYATAPPPVPPSDGIGRPTGSGLSAAASLRTTMPRRGRSLSTRSGRSGSPCRSTVALAGGSQPSVRACLCARRVARGCARVRYLLLLLLPRRRSHRMSRHVRAKLARASSRCGWSCGCKSCQSDVPRLWVVGWHGLHACTARLPSAIPRLLLCQGTLGYSPHSYSANQASARLPVVVGRCGRRRACCAE